MTDTPRPSADTPSADLEAMMPSMPFRTQTLATRKPTRFDFRPNGQERAAIAAALGLIELPSLTLKGEIRPVSRHDFDLEAELTASAVQPCSVTMAPVPCKLVEAVHRRYVADPILPEAEEIEMLDDETDPLPEVIDVAAIAAEALALALPLYPRAPDAALGTAVFAPPGVTPLSDEVLKPFAGLAALAEKLKNSDSDAS
ncbi:YceD family protein [Tabrizicola sp.]|uniref:YceD family protein n=1 Tax=Tabrizicola sp. TaxID=2005166 RepID=UPI003D2B9016